MAVGWGGGKTGVLEEANSPGGISADPGGLREGGEKRGY